MKNTHLVNFLLWVFLCPALLPAQQDQKRQRQEEQENYFKKWLSEDVRYIITPEEKGVFKNLTTPEEKEQFIEQFWYRRDSDPRTAANDFKEEHYRRIAYANERFQSGIAGWRTDRGRIYIIHGPADEIISYPSGGRYLRQPHEGGGSTSTYPFEIWRYRQVEGVGEDVELEFVDPTWAGQYHLTMDPDEKDALMRVPNAGLTLAEELGLAKKMDRPFFQPGNRERYPFRHQRAKDSPFARYERLVQVQRPKEIKYTDLQEIVEVNVSFSDLNFEIRQDYFNLNDQQVLVPITVEIQNKDLTFREEGGIYRAKIAVYGIITTITHRIIEEFEEDLGLTYTSQNLQQALASRSTYQKIIPLNKRMRYRLDLVIKDVNSGKVGVVRKGIAPPSYANGEFSASSLILSDLILPLREVPAETQMFVLGDVKVRPSVSDIFLTANPLGLYLQLYNVGMDQASRTPSIETRYRILRDGDTVLELTGETGEGLRVYSDDRAVLVKTLPTSNLEPGKYKLQVEIHDRVKGEVVIQRQDFQLVSSYGQ
ncbi:GWxTD domain-containing protein, partial [Acidobacteria bacterium AH-259-A15]|nr:GWxTD domain-containing protein [Acidobacteria bacterium AH-259-A15]